LNHTVSLYFVVRVNLSESTCRCNMIKHSDSVIPQVA
jgi:hypothetical protein